MGNCLVTKFGEVVQGNLPYLEKCVLTFVLKENYGSEAAGVASIRDAQNQPIANLGVTNLNTDGSIVSYSGGYLMLKKGTENTVRVLIDKYPVIGFGLVGSNYEFSISDVNGFYLLETFSSVGNSTLSGKISDLTLNNIKKLNLTLYETPNNFSDIAKFNTLQVLELHYCIGFTGDLSAIKDLPNLTTVVLDHTYVTDNYDTVTYLENRGVTVTYIPYA